MRIYKWINQWLFSANVDRFRRRNVLSTKRSYFQVINISQDFHNGELVDPYCMDHTQIFWIAFYRNSGSYRINMSTTHEYNCLIQHLFDRIHILIGETGLLLLYGLIHSVWYTLWWELNRFDFNFKPYSTSRYLYFTGTKLIRPLNCTVAFSSLIRAWWSTQNFPLLKYQFQV